MIDLLFLCLKKHVCYFFLIFTVLLVFAIVLEVEGAAPFKKVSIAPKSKSSTAATTSETKDGDTEESSTAAEVKVEEPKVSEHFFQAEIFEISILSVFLF